MGIQEDFHHMFKEQAAAMNTSRQPTPAERTARLNTAGGEALRKLLETAEQESRVQPPEPEPGNGFTPDVAKALGL
ncbi:hypothetical protein IWX75_002911 [Arthrobacter sp. CAN_A6]|uniref:hypothetical protein n=1 Tax=Arthrobacter sp. CAN_A6 TaxID=2787721 RepID=UPI0018CA0D76